MRSSELEQESFGRFREQEVRRIKAPKKNQMSLMAVAVETGMLEMIVLQSSINYHQRKEEEQRPF